MTTTSCIYARDGSSNSNYYYELYEINVPFNGYYKFTSNSSIDTYGYLYLQSFLPNSPSLNLIISDDDTGGNRQFQFEVYLRSDITYILVLTTYGTSIMGNYQLIIKGLNTVNIRKLNNICYVTTTTKRKFIN